MKREGETQ